MSINKVTISGNLTRDPELRATTAGTNILTFGMAVNDRRKNPSTGEYEDHANFVDCVVFGNRCDFLSRQLRKGKKVYVEGKLRYSSWERDGAKRSKLEVVVDDIDAEWTPKAQQPPQAPQSAQTPNYPPQQQYAPQQPPQAPTGYAQQPQQYGYTPQQQYQPQQYPPQGYAQPPQQAPQQRPTQQQAAQQLAAGLDAIYDDDIPF